MKEQPQKPEESLQPEDNLASAINRLAKNRTAWMLYAQSLERENTALKERVAELEFKLDLHKPGVWNAPEVK